MRIIVGINPISYQKIKEYVEENRYRDATEFLSVAVDNQILLEEGEGSERSSIDHFKGLNVHRVTRQSKIPSASPRFEAIASYHPGPLLSRPSHSVEQIAPPHLERLQSEVIWGQFNRVFPAVLVLRVLTNLLQAKGTQYVSLQTLYSEAGSQALALGQYLQRIDKEQGTARGRKLATALPASGRDQVKSLGRFRSQFVGYLEKRGGRLYGLCPSLSAIDIMQDPKAGYIVGITRFGYDFAALPNPILDEGRYDSTLGPEEISFYIDHIYNNLAQEFGSMKTVLEAVKEGASTPGSLDAIVQRINREWNPKVAATQRAGLVSRLSELGLLEVVWNGSRSNYRISEAGLVLLNRYQTGPDKLEREGMSR